MLDYSQLFSQFALGAAALAIIAPRHSCDRLLIASNYLTKFSGSMATRTSISELHAHRRFRTRSGSGHRRREDRKDNLSLLDMLVVIADHRRPDLLDRHGDHAGSVMVSLLLPKRYTATVTVLPPQQSSALGAMLASNLAASAALRG